MNALQVRAAIDAAMATAVSLNMRVENAAVLHESNRLTVRLLPCDVVARVAPMAYRASAEYEVELARMLAEMGCPVATLAAGTEPRVYARDSFVINLWSYYETLSPQEAEPAEYAHALVRLHAGMRHLQLPTPHFTDRIAEAQGLVDDRAQTPDLSEDDRGFLSQTLRDLVRVIARRGAAEQLLHGEPHPGNVLRTKDGLLFIDLETCCRGPVEFDLAPPSRSRGRALPGSRSPTATRVPAHGDGARRGVALGPR